MKFPFYSVKFAWMFHWEWDGVLGNNGKIFEEIYMQKQTKQLEITNILKVSLVKQLGLIKMTAYVYLNLYNFDFIKMKPLNNIHLRTASFYTDLLCNCISEVKLYYCINKIYNQLPYRYFLGNIFFNKIIKKFTF